MWCSGMVIGAVWIALAVQAWLRDEERKARRLDLELARAPGPVAPGRRPA